MAAWTLAEAREHLAAWLEAEKAVAEAGQSWTVGGQSYTKADLPAIKAQILFWQREVERLEQGARRGPRVRRAVFYDF